MSQKFFLNFSFQHNRFKDGKFSIYTHLITVHDIKAPKA